MENFNNLELIRNMEDRKTYLEKLLQKALRQKEKLRDVPTNKIRIQKHGNVYQYYLRENSKDTSGRYLKREEEKIAQQIMQKEYINNLIREIEKELSIIDIYMSKVVSNQTLALYENLHEGRKQLIEPLEISDEEYVKRWLSIPYKGKDFAPNTPELYTQKMERVRSKSEIIIANTLQKYNIPYKYECPILLKGYGTVYPDFTLLNVRKRKEIYLEHLGLIDDKDYREKTMRKLSTYELNQIYPGDNLIITYESSAFPIDVKSLERKIKKYLL